ncbi:MAG: cadmium-translocating P-type ATPase [Ignavibacteriales bacterium]|nr:cadmium-translocating P-type ATPase [Ignavibacteriales bacterium]
MTNSTDTKQSVFTVSDLCCATEEALIRKKLSNLAGVRSLQFNLVSHKLTVEHSTQEQEILKALGQVGLPGRLESSPFPTKHKSSRRLLYSVVFSAAFFAGGQFARFLDAAPIISSGLFLISIVFGGWQVGIKAFKAVKNFSLDMNFLMTAAVIGAVAIGEHAEGAAVMLLFALSLLLESLSMEKTRNAVHSLMKLSPTTATVKRGTIESVVAVESVGVGEVIVLRPGERIPLDGEVVGGFSTVDQSAITGESVPVVKKTGSTVFAGSLNQRGTLDVRATKRASDSTIARIVHLVEEAESQKAPSQTFVEKFARSYTPAVFLLAVCIALVPPLMFQQEFGEWFYRALVLLVIACPCALVISTPVTIISALTNAARNGLLIKGGKHLERLAVVDAVAFDKTGTLTEGNVAVVDVISFDSISAQEITKIAAAVELRSEHHLAGALLRYAEQQRIALDDLAVDHFESVPGKGVRATVNQKNFTLGNHQFAEELKVCSPRVEEILAELEAKGQTAIILADERQALGVISVADRIRTESTSALESLRKLGVRESILLTGDNRGTAQRVSAQLGFDTVEAELLPEDKLSLIRKLKSRYKTVSMIGDGVNDAPALAMSDVGIAMGGIGSDTTLETADIVLMSDDLSKVPYGVSLARKTLRIVKQNIMFALAVKAIFLVLGVFGLTSLWLAILADDGATLLVVLNGMRVLRSRL